MGFNALILQSVCQFKDQLLRRVPVLITHPSGPRISQPCSGYGQLLLRSCACAVLCCREKRHVTVSRLFCAFLPKRHCLGVPLCRSVLCGCTFETAYFCACMPPLFVFTFCFFFSLLFPNQVFDVFYTLSTLSRFHFVGCGRPVGSQPYVCPRCHCFPRTRGSRRARCAKSREKQC